jgi:hypothetical protein
LIRKFYGHRTARVQLLRHSNDQAAELEQTLAQIVRFLWRPIMCVHA